MPFLTVFFYFIYEIYGRTSRNKTMKGVFVMIDNITLEAMENRFSDVNKVMQDVRENNREYSYKNGQLMVTLPFSILIVECVGDLLMHTLVYKHLWDKFKEYQLEYSIEPESMVCYMNANNWSRRSLSGLASDYALTLLVENEVEDVHQLIAKSFAPKIEPTIFGDVYYALVGVADTKPAGEFGLSDSTTIYGIFNNLRALRDSFKDLQERIATTKDDAVRNAKYEFAVHPFVPNRCFGFGTEVSSSFYLE